MNKYPHLFLSLFLTFILVAPFILRTRYRLEPYPAIILPSGANRVNVKSKEISIKRTSIWGKHQKDMTWQQIDVETFLSPIPPHFFGSILKSSLGLNSKRRTINLPIGIKVLTKKVNFKEVQNAKNWWSQKLVKLGYASDEIMIVREQIKFNNKTGKIVEITRINERIIQLD